MLFIFYCLFKPPTSDFRCFSCAYMVVMCVSYMCIAMSNTLTIHCDVHCKSLNKTLGILLLEETLQYYCNTLLNISVINYNTVNL